MIRRRFATEIRKEVIDSLLPERFNQGVRDLGVKPVGQPQVTELTVEDGQPLHVKAVFEFIPDFSIDGYQDVTVEKPSVEVTDEEFSARDRSSCASRAPPLSRSKKTARWWMATGRRSPTPARSKGEADAAPLAGEDTLVEIGGKDTVEAFTNGPARRQARPGTEGRGHLSGRLLRGQAGRQDRRLRRDSQGHQEAHSCRN